MSRQDANANFALTSFLDGANATYIDQLYARYENDPSSVDPDWVDFFKTLKDQPADVAKNAQGPSWEKANWPATPNDDLTSALDGNWAQVEKAVGGKIAAKAQAAGSNLTSADIQQATRDSVRALMLIRAYRMRGHFHANLDPLGIEGQKDHEELDPRSYGFTDADFDRKIFLDHVLGLETGTLREIVAICQRTYCQTLGVDRVVRNVAFFDVRSSTSKKSRAWPSRRPRIHRFFAAESRWSNSALSVPQYAARNRNKMSSRLHHARFLCTASSVVSSSPK